MTSKKTNARGAVVIGGGIAGTTCALELRQYLAEHEAQVGTVPITVIDPNPTVILGLAESRLSKLLEWVSVSEVGASTWAAETAVTHIQKRATFLSKDELTLSDGKRMPFTACCIATGASPFLPKAFHSKQYSEFIHSIRDTDSVESLQL